MIRLIKFNKKWKMQLLFKINILYQKFSNYLSKLISKKKKINKDFKNLLKLKISS